MTGECDYNEAFMLLLQGKRIRASECYVGNQEIVYSVDGIPVSPNDVLCDAIDDLEFCDDVYVHIISHGETEIQVEYHVVRDYQSKDYGDYD